MVHNTCPQTQILKKARGPSIAGMEEFRSPVQPYHIHIRLLNHQSSLGIQCVGEDGERILKQVLFIGYGIFPLFFFRFPRGFFFRNQFSMLARKQASKPASQQGSKQASNPASKQASKQASKWASKQASQQASKQARKPASQPASKQAKESKESEDIFLKDCFCVFFVFQPGFCGFCGFFGFCGLGFCGFTILYLSIYLSKLT